MTEDLIRYDILAQDALRGVVRKVLSEVSRTGLPGDHHFFITFATGAPGVRISGRLLMKYPEEMTIVIQHQYRDLTVTEHAFEVGLSFNSIAERLYVPFSAVVKFADPSVGFELRFAPASAPGEAAAPAAEPLPAEEKAPLTLVPPAKGADEAAETTPSSDSAAQVVSLDAFRKK
jgi:hypothetical protein